MMNRKMGVMLATALGMSLAVLLFLLITPQSKVLLDWLTLGFLLLGILGITMLLAQKGGILFANLTLGSVSGIYLCMNLAISIFAHIFLKEQILRYIALQLVLLILAAAVCTVLVCFINSQERNRKAE